MTQVCRSPLKIFSPSTNGLMRYIIVTDSTGTKMGKHGVDRVVNEIMGILYVGY